MDYSIKDRACSGSPQSSNDALQAQRLTHLVPHSHQTETRSVQSTYPVSAILTMSAEVHKVIGPFRSSLARSGVDAADIPQSGAAIWKEQSGDSQE